MPAKKYHVHLSLEERDELKLGLVHNIDLEWIANPDLRARCELRCLQLARKLMINTEQFTDITEMTTAAAFRH